MTTTPGDTDVATVDLTQTERFVVRQTALKSDEQLIAAGHYNNVWGNITTYETFVLGSPFVGVQEMIMVRADRFPCHGNISGRQGVNIMRSLGFRPPTLREFLAFGAEDLPDKWVIKKNDCSDEWIGSVSKWYYVIGANLHYRAPNQSRYDCAPAIWSHSGRRGLTVTSMYNGMDHAWPRNPHYLWVPLS